MTRIYEVIKTYKVTVIYEVIIIYQMKNKWKVEKICKLKNKLNARDFYYEIKKFTLARNC